MGWKNTNIQATSTKEVGGGGSWPASSLLVHGRHGRRPPQTKRVNGQPVLDNRIYTNWASLSNTVDLLSTPPHQHPISSPIPSASSPSSGEKTTTNQLAALVPFFRPASGEFPPNVLQPGLHGLFGCYYYFLYID